MLLIAWLKKAYWSARQRRYGRRPKTNGRRAAGRQGLSKGQACWSYQKYAGACFIIFLTVLMMPLALTAWQKRSKRQKRQSTRQFSCSKSMAISRRNLSETHGEYMRVIRLALILQFKKYLIIYSSF